jgi:hypothetical protein
MWGELPDIPTEDIPENYVVTTDRSVMNEAVAVVFHVPSLKSEISIRKQSGQIWIAWFMECEAHYPLMSDSDYMKCFDLKMSYRLGSDIPTPYVQSDFRKSLNHPCAEKKEGNIVNSFISSTYNKSGRIELLMELMSLIDVHSYGKLFQNRKVAGDNGRSFKLNTMATYKFSIAFENAVAKDYVTEKFYDPLMAGSVPVYLGAPNIEDFAPGDNCFINASDWASPKHLARYIMEVAEDEALYRSYFEWRDRPLRQNFTSLLELQKVHPFVRLCHKIDAML